MLKILSFVLATTYTTFLPTPIFLGGNLIGVMLTNSQILEILNRSLATTAAFLQISESALQEFDSALKSTQKPMYLWPSPILKRYSLLKKNYTSDLRIFFSTLASVRAHQPEAKPAQSKSEERAPEPAPLMKYVLDQNIEVTIVDGVTKTKIDLDARHWLDRKPLEQVEYMMRHYYFHGSQIPPEYDFVMENEGVYYGPTQSVYIGYAPEEFLRLCQLEIDTQAEHVIDGERVLYRRLKNTVPLERPSRENQEQT